MAAVSTKDVIEKELMTFALSSTIIQTISNKHERLRALFEHNPSGTMEFLIVNGAVSGFNVLHAFNLPYNGSGHTAKTWKANGEEIKGYLFELCQKLKTTDGLSLTDAFKKAAEDLATYIHEQYLKRLPLWPSIWRTQSARIALDKSDSYVQPNHDIVVWSCIGAVTVTDETTTLNYKSSFTGSPYIRAVKIDGKRVRDLEILAADQSLEYTKNWVDNKQKYRILNGGTFNDLN